MLISRLIDFRRVIWKLHVSKKYFLYCFKNLFKNNKIIQYSMKVNNNTLEANSLCDRKKKVTVTYIEHTVLFRYNK